MADPDAPASNVSNLIASSSSPNHPQESFSWRNRTTMIYVSAGFVALASAFFLQIHFFPASHGVIGWTAADTPDQAQVVSPKSFAVLDTVPPATEFNGSNIFILPGQTLASLKAKPFHIYDDSFYSIIGTNPSLTLIADGGTNPLFHEAVIWYPPTDEVFFVQNAGAKAAGTGLAKSAIVEKISLKAAAAAAAQGNFNATGQVKVTTVNSKPQVVNPNGGTNYKNQLLFVGEGQGADVAPSIFLVDPTPPYNATVILNNFFGRQFNSLNDIAVNPRNKELYFTDVIYGVAQDFRPAVGLPNQVYRFNPDTGLVSVVADSLNFNKPNGFTFSPDGKYAYVTDTGPSLGFAPPDYSLPAAIYRFDVNEDGTFSNRMTFAFITPGNPDGVHCDSQGNVYTGAGDGVQVFNPSGKLIGKIFLGETSANFNFAGTGRMVICAETQLFYVEGLAASGAPITDYDYSQIL